jgi:hypothetical protein
MYVCATHGCSEAFCGYCDEPLFCSACYMDLTPLCAVSWPGHERNMGPLFEAFERHVQRQFEQYVMGRSHPSESMLASLVEQYRRRGVPAIRARFEGDGIVVEVAQPAGFG